MHFLIADRDDHAAEILRRDLVHLGHTVERAPTRIAAIDAILLAERIDVVLIVADVDGGGVADIARTASLMLSVPWIVVVSTGRLGQEAAFDLGRLGVSRLLSQRPTAASLVEVVDDVKRERPPPVHSVLSRYLGHVSLLGFEEEVRESLMLLALEKTGGNRKAAARLLRTSRQLIQRAANAE